MKTSYVLPLPLLALSMFVLGLPRPTGAMADTPEVCLTSDCSSNKLTLHWYGAPGLILQQATSLANPVWQDVPGSKGMSIYELPMTNNMAFFRVVNRDSFADTDADGLDDFWETNGWEIAIDAYGYGSDALVTRHVTGDPSLADTDGDGVDDFWELIFGTDPRSADTDADGVSDYDELFVYNTDPCSVDTDGDARGPNQNLPPNPMLFDGNELKYARTSPSLADTDGDGRTDYEEYNQPGRNPLIAEVPRLAVQLVDTVDVRLDVQYAEELGQQHEYGGELTVSDSTRSMYSTSSSVNWNVTVGAEVECGLVPSASVSTEVSVGGEVTTGFEKESSHSVEDSHSDYLTDTRTRTETTATGSMSAGIRLVNTGPVTFTLTDLGLTVRYLEPGTGAARSFQTLATLVPTLGANGITLAPGDSTPVLQVQATGLNADRVKQFMARPNSLCLEPAYYELQNAQGLNFDYLEDITRWRTADVQIDYGNGSNEEYRVATNVRRNPNGSYAGVTMGDVMSNILHIAFQTVPRQTLQTNSPTNERVLYSVRSVATTGITNGFWSVAWSGAGTQSAHTNFEDMPLHAGDQVLLVFVKDDDGDGLFSAEEQFYGTDGTSSADSDADELSDAFEVRTGWDVTVAGQPAYHVFSDPAQVDTDGDGSTDDQEFLAGTDPTKPDTDVDGIPDNLDPHPLVPAKVLRVKWDATPGGNSVTNGAAWDTAFTNLQDALTVARNAATDGNPSNDVAEIWVAAGVYKPTTTNNRNATFQLVNNTALYGGFSGGETKQSQRDHDPLSNDTILSGDLQGNDASTLSDDPASFTNDNSYVVCSALNNISGGTVLDGFMITGGCAPDSSPGGGLNCEGRPKLKNLFFRANYGLSGAGVYVKIWPPTPEPFVISDCMFVQNGAGAGGGGGMACSVLNWALATQAFIITNCQFYNNTTDSGDGGGLEVMWGTFDIENCIFGFNVSSTSSGRGGGLAVGRPATARISRCQFLGNTSGSGGAGLVLIDSIPLYDLKVEVVQSVFWGNSTPYYGGAIQADGLSGSDGNQRLYLLNSCIVSNTASSGGHGVNLNHCTGWIENSILWGNAIRLGSGTTISVRTTCLAEANTYPGNGNIKTDPKFVDSSAGNLRLASGSPCIDRGSNYEDYDMLTPGFQLLPGTDLEGNTRIVDGNTDGTATVDMGAYEYQGQ